MWCLFPGITFCIFLGGASLALYGEESTTPKLLTARPAVPFIEVRQHELGTGIMHTGFLRWTPTLTLAEAVAAAGGFQGRNDLVRTERVTPSLSPDRRFKKKQFLQDRGAQLETFRPGDRVTISYLMKPW